MGAFREACEIMVRMWTEERTTFHGKYYTIDGAINEPKGVQQPHIPLWIGGGGEQVTLKLVAQWGSASNFGGELDVIRHKLDVLRGHCATLDRDFDSLVRSSNINVFLHEPGADPVAATAEARGAQSYEDFARGYFVGTSEQLIAHIEQLVEAGINYVITYFPGVAYDHTQMFKFAQEVMPHFSA